MRPYVSNAPKPVRPAVLGRQAPFVLACLIAPIVGFHSPSGPALARSIGAQLPVKLEALGISESIFVLDLTPHKYRFQAISNGSEVVWSYRKSIPCGYVCSRPQHASTKAHSLVVESFSNYEINLFGQPNLTIVSRGLSEIPEDHPAIHQAAAIRQRGMVESKMAISYKDVGALLASRVFSQEFISFPVGFGTAERRLSGSFGVERSMSGGEQSSTQQFERQTSNNERYNASSSHQPLSEGIGPRNPSLPPMGDREAFSRIAILVAGAPLLGWFFGWWAGRRYGQTLLSFYGPIVLGLMTTAVFIFLTLG